MKFLSRILLYATSTLSLLLSIAFLSIWIRSHYVQDYIDINDNFIVNPTASKVEPHSRRIVIDSTWGLLRISSVNQSYGQYTQQQAQVFKNTHRANWVRMAPHREPQKWIRTGPEGKLNAAGFYYWRGQQPNRPNIQMRVVGTPWWAPTALFLLPPLIHFIFALLHRRRKIRNACPTCGYDLRATPDRCPECGTSTPLALVVSA